MHDMMKKPELSEICQIEKDLISALKTVTAHGVFAKDVDAKELGELVDMVKDMAETKRNCWEACYYETVTMAMKEYDEDDDVMGYNRNRYASGRYAPSGTGNRTMGYNMMPVYPNNKRDPYVFNPNEGERFDKGTDSYGYSHDRDMRESKYGKPFREYEDARRHYTETHSAEDKTHMDKKAMEHVNQSMMTLREIWKNADPAVKKEVASSISSLASEFKMA